MKVKPSSTPPILRNEGYDHPSVFVPDNLLREARRQKALPNGTVPAICVLDPMAISSATCWMPTERGPTHPGPVVTHPSTTLNTMGFNSASSAVRWEPP